MKKRIFLVIFISTLFFSGFAQKNQDSIIQSTINSIKKSFDLILLDKKNEATIVAEKGLKSLELIKNDSIKRKLKGSLYSNLYLIDFKTHKKISQKILFLFNESENLFCKNKDTIAFVRNYNNLGDFYLQLNDIDNALIYFNKGLNFIKGTNGFNGSKKILYANIGNALSKSKIPNYQKSLTYLFNALELKTNPEDIVNIRLESSTYKEIAIVYTKLKNYNQALFYYDKCIESAKKHGFYSIIIDGYFEKSKLYKFQNKVSLANLSLEKVIQFKDSLEKQSKKDLITGLDYRLTLKQKEKELAIIEKENFYSQKRLKNIKIFSFFFVVLSCLLFVTSYFLCKSNIKLKFERDKTKQLSKVQSRFYSEISHELRTPLYAVIEISGFLIKEIGKTKNREFLESLKFSANHLLLLINNMLEITKINSGKVTINNSEFNLESLIQNMLETLEYFRKNSENKITLNYDKTIPKFIIGDSLKLSRILINIISNAIKYTEKGSIVIDVKTLKQDNDTISIYFAVTDDGLGIPEENQAFIFQNYFRGEFENNMFYNGTGLGLSITKELLTILNSEIKLESNLGVGSKFYFELSFNKKHTPIKHKVDISFFLNKIKDKQFLIVDDNKINLLVTKKVLDELNLKCDIVSSGKKAIKALNTKHYDCILMDIHMPKFDGYQTAKEIREFNARVSIIALTAASAEGVENKIADFGIDDYVFKPFSTYELLKKIADAITKRRS